MTSVRRALGWSFLERFALIGLNLFSYVLIARLLTPRQIGLYSVVAALLGVLQVIREFGVGNYLIQAQTLDQERLDTALGFSLGLGALAFVLTCLASPIAAQVYADPEVAPVLRIVAISLLMLPLCSIGQALLRRSLKFERLLHTSVAGGVGGLVVTLGLAFWGAGPASLAWGAVATNTIVAVGCWVGLRGQPHPRRLRLSAWRELFTFGRQSTLSAVVTTVSIDINDLVVGRVLGLAPVALISRAMGLMNLWQRDLLQAARNVALPALAKAHREGAEIEPLFLHSTGAVIALSLPYYGFLGLFPLESLRLLAGPQWDAAVPMVVVFALAGACVCMSTLIPTLLLAVGRVDLASRADIVFASLRVGAVIGAALCFQSMMAIALGFLVAFALAPLVFLYFKQQAVTTDFGRLRALVLRTLWVTGTALAPALAVRQWWGWGTEQPLPLPYFLGLAVVVIVLWLLALQWWHHPVAQDPIYLKGRARLHALIARPPAA